VNKFVRGSLVMQPREGEVGREGGQGGEGRGGEGGREVVSADCGSISSWESLCGAPWSCSRGRGREGEREGREGGKEGLSYFMSSHTTTTHTHIRTYL